MSSFKTLLLAHHTGDDPATRIAIKQFTERVARRSGGLLNITDIPGGTLGSIPAMLQMLTQGEVDMALVPFDRLGELLPKFSLTCMPFVFDDLAHADRVLNGPFADWAMPDLLQRGLHRLSSWEWGFRQISNNARPILHPDDLRGLRIRVPPIPQYQEAMLALGCVPVIVEFSQLASVMRQGLVDGQENPIAVIHAYKIYENQRYLSLIDYSYGGMLQLINRQHFEALSIEHQQILSEESTNAATTMREKIRSQQAAQLEALRGFGMQIDSPDHAPFQAAMASALTHLVTRFGETRARTFLEMVEHMRPATNEEQLP
ncbi:hypothetical protein GCM10027046_09860 [Uliginosibacterium flavum]|uniref:TRAP transporter substrate-binding protein n=1 Tax=Uliginosibacterium flavum TaxID=1396831 RepID=A0ABV2TIH1_9RHOO